MILFALKIIIVHSGITRAYKGECGCSDGEMCEDIPKCFYKKALKQLTQNIQECKKYEKLLNNITNIIKNRVEERFYKNCKYFKVCTNACGLVIQKELSTVLDIISKAKENGNAR